ncbi:HIT domain-containing protein [Candidatus Woesearchaeota archaeon]|nr:HIT domain-containing protein [Candidatus Woesearchaeota archaeon]
MADCPVCTEKKTYEDENIAMLTAGSVTLVVPKQHYPIMEQTPDFIIEKMFIHANHTLLQMFEKGAQGANLIITNGVSAGQTLPHFAMQLIERKENDGLFPLWNPRKLDEETMGAIELKLKEACQNIGVWEEQPKPEEKKEEKTETNETYIKRYLRIP